MQKVPADAVAKVFLPGQTFLMSTYDLICIGAGPTGLACAIEAKRVGMRPLVIDKGCLCNSLYHYPVNMVFFTTPELLEIGDLPLTSAAGNESRAPTENSACTRAMSREMPRNSQPKKSR